MKKLVYFLFLILIVPQFLKANDIPKKPSPARAINDYVGLLNPSEQQSLEAKLDNFNKKTSTQIVVVIVDTLNGDVPYEFATKIGHKWKVGQKGFDNGFVVLVKEKTATSEGKAFIAVGYGVEGTVPDAVAKRIVENEMLPRFKQEDYYGGINAATNTLMELTKGEFTAQQYMKKTKKKYPLMGLFMGLFIFLFFVMNIFGRAGAVRRNSIGRGIPFWILMGMLGSGSQGGGSFGNFSSGGGSFGGDGGFGGGFGGGDFGGGGAGGSW